MFRSLLRAVCVLSCLTFFSFFCANAQASQAVSAGGGGDQFASAATAVDAATLLTERSRVALWGIESVDSVSGSLGLQARTSLDDLIGGKPVRCKVLAWEGDVPASQCLASGDADLALEMLRRGFAVVDRPAVLGSVFEKPFLDAERHARTLGKGAWVDVGDVNKLKTEEFLGLALVVLVLGPFLGFVALALVGFLGFRKVVALQREQIEEVFSRQDQMREREKFVVAAMFETELNANKVKLEAFLTIYEEILRNLRDAGRQQRFRQTGEIVHEQPPLNRAVFDAYKDRLELLGSKLAAELTGIYSSVVSDPRYVTLEPGMPVEKAVQKVEEIIEGARSFMAPTDRALSGLSVIVRDRGKSVLPGAEG